MVGRFKKYEIWSNEKIPVSEMNEEKRIDRFDLIFI